MKRAYLTFLAVVGLTAAAYCQSSENDEQWYEGYLVTTSNDTIHGELSYNMVTNMVKVRQEGSMRVYSSFQTFHFKLYDDMDRRWRKFFSIPYSLKYDRESPILFELLSEGKLSLLAREHWRHTSRNVDLEKTQYLRKDYFFVNRTGDIQHTQPRKSQLLDLMADHQDELRRFIRANYLDLSREKSLRIVTTYYNKLVLEDERNVQKEAVAAQSSPASDLILGANKAGTQTWMNTDL